MSDITIAIDGYSSCGKSTLARALAAELDYVFVDSGAMYRAVTYAFLRDGIDVTDDAAAGSHVRGLRLGFEVRAGRQTLFLGEEPLDGELRTMEVNRYVSPVATLSSVRAYLVEHQQAMGRRGGIVMDGRDIGTVVFPGAALKLFVTASVPVRVERRRGELAAAGREVTADKVKANLLERDRIDSTREDSPLRQAEDAVLLDNTNLTRGEQLAMALALARARIDDRLN